MYKSMGAISAALLPLAVVAAPNDVPGQPGYTYVQGSYIASGDVKAKLATSGDYDGFVARGSLTITRHAFLNAHYDWLDIDDSRTDVNRASVGGGLNDFYDYGGGAGTGLGYYGQISYERLAFDDAPILGDQHANGVGADVGLRWAVHPNIEINPHVGLVDYAAFSDDPLIDEADGLRYGLQVVGQVIENVAVTAAYNGSEVDINPLGLNFDNEFRLGARLYF